MNDFQNYEKKCDGKNGLSVGKKAGFRRNLDLIFQYDGKKVVKIRFNFQIFEKIRSNHLVCQISYF